MEVQKLKKHLGIDEMPKELDTLVEFQNNSGFENYSKGFGIYTDNLNHWSTEPEFQEKLKAFAQANGSGSQYALWEDVKGKKLQERPIVVFGDEGGVHIVAENLLQLMHLLTFDCEISVDWEEVYFYKDEKDHQGTKDSAKYRAMLKVKFNLETITQSQANEIILNAQKIHKIKFDLWIKQFVVL